MCRRRTRGSCSAPTTITAGSRLFGDSWIGLSMSTDGARTWRDRSARRVSVRARRVGAADPVVRTVPGLGLVSYITLSRTDGRGTLVARPDARAQQGKWRAVSVLPEAPHRHRNARTVQRQAGHAGRCRSRRWHDQRRGAAGSEGNGAFQLLAVPRQRQQLVVADLSHVLERLRPDVVQPEEAEREPRHQPGSRPRGRRRDQYDCCHLAPGRRHEPGGRHRCGPLDNGGQTWSKAKVVWTAPSGGFFDQDTLRRPVPDALDAVDRPRRHGLPRLLVGARLRVESRRRADRRLEFARRAHVEHSRGRQSLRRAADIRSSRSQRSRADGCRSTGSTRGTTNPGTFGRYIADFRTDSAGNRCGARRAVAGVRPAAFHLSAVGRHLRGAGRRRGVERSGVPGLLRPRRQSRAIGSASWAAFAGSWSSTSSIARLFQKGAVAFNGDYHAVAGQRYRPSETIAGAWIRNTAPSTSHALFYSAFTDNRDVQGYVWAGPPATSFTPAGVTQQGESGSRPSARAARPRRRRATKPCGPPATVRARAYQNIYAAATFPGLVVTSPSARSRPAPSSAHMSCSFRT